MTSEITQEKQQLQHASPRSLGLEPDKYGLPCANCKVYYSANLNVCPICRCVERVPANGAAQFSSASIF